MTEVAVTILSHSSYKDSIDYYHVVGEVKNTGSKNLKYVKLTATLYDSANTVVDTTFTYTAIDVLVPNQKSPFEIISTKKASVDHYTVVVSDYSETSEQPYRQFSVLSKTGSLNSIGYYEVVGEVKNTGSKSVTYVRVDITCYDSAGKVVATSFTYSDPKDLSAGQTAPFKAYVTDKNVASKIVSFEVQVQCQQTA